MEWNGAGGAGQYYTGRIDENHCTRCCRCYCKLCGILAAEMERTAVQKAPAKRGIVEYLRKEASASFFSCEPWAMSNKKEYWVQNEKEVEHNEIEEKIANSDTSLLSIRTCIKTAHSFLKQPTFYYTFLVSCLHHLVAHSWRLAASLYNSMTLSIKTMWIKKGVEKQCVLPVIC